MWKNKQGIEKYNEIVDFRNSIRSFVVVNNQINSDDNLINIYNKFDENLRSMLKVYEDCENNNSSNYGTCLKEFSKEFDKLRSEI